MRVITGEYGGRRLKSQPGKNTRPTTDKIKEAMFQMAGPYFSGGAVLDLYSGSGALGIEAVSRGMDKGYLVDQNAKAVQVMKENVAITKEEEKFEIFQKKSSSALKEFASKEIKFSLVILDPPYKSEQILEDIEALIQLDLLDSEAVVICETDSDVDLPETIGNLTLFKTKNYGSTNLFFYEAGGYDE